MDWTVPTATVSSLKEGQTGVPAWALQRCLNSFELDYDLVEDGSYGPATTLAVQDYQQRTELLADGIAGPKTQHRFVRSLELRIEVNATLPAGLIPSVVQGESGRFIAAVNWAILGGVDCGYTQRRIRVPTSPDTVEWAFDSKVQVQLLAQNLVDKYSNYINRAAVKPRTDRFVYGWRLAVLYHNWPFAAEQLASGGTLSTTKKADWVPQGVRFDDGEPVVSYSDWAAFYSMGSKAHQHEGRMVDLTNFGVPSYG